jgi:hypothetical protein
MCCDDGEQVNTASKRASREGAEPQARYLESERCEVELAETYWRDLLPDDFPDDLIIKAAFWFGASRRVNASLRNRLIASQINDILDRKAWVGTDFGELVFTG